LIEAILPVSNLIDFERFHMGIALFTLAGWLAPLQAIASSPARNRTRRAGSRHLSDRFMARRDAPVAPGANGHQAEKAENAGPKAPPSKPLRVVRVAETGFQPGCAGRMVISGRMADVCAELDRLAEREGCLQRS
jgi:hypothetical protein